MRIEALNHVAHLQKEAIEYIWKCWGNQNNRKFYEDCINHAFLGAQSLPGFYLLLEGNQIQGCYALLTNDIISRQDLMPWLACLYVNESVRNQGWAGKLLEHGLEEAKRMGFSTLYLSTDLEGFYEKKGWKLFGRGYNLWDEPSKIYLHFTGGFKE